MGTSDLVLLSLCGNLYSPVSSLVYEKGNTPVQPTPRLTAILASSQHQIDSGQQPLPTTQRLRGPTLTLSHPCRCTLPCCLLLYVASGKGSLVEVAQEEVQIGQTGHPSAWPHLTGYRWPTAQHPNSTFF